MSGISFLIGPYRKEGGLRGKEFLPGSRLRAIPFWPQGDWQTSMFFRLSSLNPKAFCIVPHCVTT